MSGCVSLCAWVGARLHVAARMRYCESMEYGGVEAQKDALGIQKKSILFHV